MFITKKLSDIFIILKKAGGGRGGKWWVVNGSLATWKDIAIIFQQVGFQVMLLKTYLMKLKRIIMSIDKQKILFHLWYAPLIQKYYIIDHTNKCTDS